ncbi:MAG: methyltransferase [Thermodesulfobacteriota bacterium]
MLPKPSPWGPERLRAAASAYWEACALHAAVQTGLAAALAQGPATAPELCQRLGLDPRGLAILLRALCVLELVNETDERYTLNPAAAPHLTPGDPRDMSDIILHMADMVGDWSHLAECVKSGRPVRRPEPDQPGPGPQRDHFYRAMRDIARQQATGLSGRLGLRPGQSLIDLGGGPGVYGLTFAEEVPGLKVTVFDLPQAREHFLAESQVHPKARDVVFRAGDFHVDDLGGPYDVAWLSQILHGEGPEDCADLLARAVAALKPGGQLWVQEFVVDIPGHPWAGLFGLNMLVNTRQGMAYSRQELIYMLVTAGLRQVRYGGKTREGAAAALLWGQKPE